jgi:galactose oxidase-like protein
MNQTPRQLSIHVLAASALLLGACSVDVAGQIPCADDVSCPSDYPVCSQGKCIAGTSTANASVAIVGVDGHAAADFLSGTVRVQVTARATSGVQGVTLASGSTSFPASATPAVPPLFAFDVNTASLANGDQTLTATVTAGNGASGTANATLHVDNAQPVINSFTVVGGGAAATVTSGKSIGLTASFTGGSGVISAAGGGSASLNTGATVLVSPDVQTTFKLTVVSRSGVTTSSGTNPSDVTISVAAPVSFTGNASVSPSAIQQGPAPGTNFTFTAPTFPAGIVADVKDPGGSVVATINTSGGTAPVPIPATSPGTTQLAYSMVLRNAATTPDTTVFPLVVSVGSPPVIVAFTGTTTITSGGSAPIQATFSGGNGVITPGNIPILSGGTVLVAPSSNTTYTLTVTNPTTLASVSSGTTPPNVVVTVVAPAVVTSFTASSLHTTAGDPLTFNLSTTGVAGDASVTGTCSPAAAVTPFTITGANGASLGQTAPAVSASPTTCTYSASVQNAAGTSVVTRLVISVEQAPTITSFAFQTTGTQAAFFALHDDVVLSHTYNARGGTATINGVAAGVSTTTFTNLRVTTAYTLTVTNLAGKSVTSGPATATLAPGSWSALNDTPIDVRRGATVTGLDDGTVLVAGGLNGGGAPLNTAQLCDATGACSSISMGATGRAFHTAVKLGNGKVLVAGGYTASGPATPTDTVVLFDPATATFSSLGTNLTSARALHVAVLLSGTKVLIAGGTSGATPTNDLQTAMTYDASGPTATATNNNMGQKRANFTGTLLLSGKVLIVGGKASDVTAELFDPAGGGGTGTFSTLTPQLPTNEDKRNHTAVLLDDVNFVGQVLISGGTTTLASGPSRTQFLFNPAGSGAFTAAPSLVTSRSNHAAVLLTSHSVLLCGGTSNGSNTLSSCERYDPLLALGTMFPTAPMVETIGRKDFGMAPLQNGTATPPALVQIFAAGGEPTTPEFWAEAYDSN